MKSEKDILNQIKKHIFLEYMRRFEQAQIREHKKCKYNYQHSLDTRRQLHGEYNPDYNKVKPVKLEVWQQPKMGLCIYGLEDPSSWEGDICDSDEKAKCCPYYEGETKEKIQSDMTAMLADPQRLKDELPIVYALLWVLSDLNSDISLTWFQRLKLYFVTVKVEPKQESPLDLLLEGVEKNGI